MLHAISTHSACQVFEAEDFTCQALTFNGVTYGSPKEHVRTWIVVWDISRDVANELGLPKNVHSLMNHLHLEKYPVENFLMSEETLESLFKVCSYGATMRSQKGER